MVDVEERHRLGRLSFTAGQANGSNGGRDEPLGLSDDRDGVLYVPDTVEPGAPLLVFLHGAAGSGRAHLRAVLAAADRYGVIVAAPDSRAQGTWDLIVERGFGPDVAFVERMLDDVAGRVDADLSRLAIGGVSDGASYALSIGLTNGDVFSTVVAFSPGFLAVLEAVDRPRVFVSHGTADPILPIDVCSRPLVHALRADGYEVEFHEFDGGHTVPPAVSDDGIRWWLSPS